MNKQKLSKTKKHNKKDCKKNSKKIYDYGIKNNLFGRYKIIVSNNID